MDEIVKLLPSGYGQGLVSFKKRCTDIQTHDNGVTVVFADETSENFDAVIGADGVKSRVRNILHGEREPQFTGKYAYRGLVPMKDAVEAVGELGILDQAFTLGYGGHLVTFPVNQGKTLNVVAIKSASDWTHGDKWVVQTTVEDVLKDFKDFHESIQKILSLLHNPDKWGLFDLPPLDTYVNGGRISLVGDSAHASTPHMGAGAGMAIEDAAVLSRLLGQVKAPDSAQLARAFAAYNAVRRERTQQLVASSRRVGLLYDFQGPGVEDDVGKIRDAFLSQWNWIWDLDIEHHCSEAVAIMHELAI